MANPEVRSLAQLIEDFDAGQPEQLKMINLIKSVYATRILAQSGVAIPNSNPGNTNENILATVTIPGGAMGPNGVIEIISLWSMTNSANTKTPRIRLGGIGGTAFFVTGYGAGVAVAQQYHSIRNRGTVNSQVGCDASFFTAFASAAGSVTTGAINTNLNQDLVFTAQLALGTEQLGLEAYSVRLIHGLT